MVTLGSAQHEIPLAAVGAGAAVIVVGTVGLVVRAPLSRVPENAMKFGVGVMLTTFGTFWAAEGAGVHWPGADAAILVILAVMLLAPLGLMKLIQRRRTAVLAVEPAAPSVPVQP